MTNFIKGKAAKIKAIYSRKALKNSREN